jgi:hypothetical protein
LKSIRLDPAHWHPAARGDANPTRHSVIQRIKDEHEQKALSRSVDGDDYRTDDLRFCAYR